MNTNYSLSGKAIVTTVAQSSSYLVLGLDDGRLHVFSTQGEVLYKLRAEFSPSSLTVRQHQLIVGCRDGSIESWDLFTGAIKDILWYDEGTIVSSSRDSSLKIWSTEDWACTHELAGHTAPVISIAIDHDTLISASHDQTCKVWDANAGTLKRTLTGHHAKIFSMDFDGKIVVSGDLIGEVRVWDAMTGLCKAILHGHKSIVNHVRLHHGLIMTAGADGSIKAWSSATSTEVWTIPQAHPNAVNSISVKDDIFVSGGSGDAVSIWQVGTGALLYKIGGHYSAIWQVGFLNQGSNKVFATFWDDGSSLAIMSLLHS
ncbi:WD40 repeat-like protein [Dissoconium aciculare CBS 342.82]|uniref:WD40 repeat-like protein n=1 Tax=Dissoconium aciculare CBS 342.82 TaxID=1314786 RepID=A0A6J3MAW6_9PEZI|nr:WD40 repeat-like protein [Dissoconium aciculare CBS 342.82]KAF1823972.1 WD40 repeat-like protein [Dissoconium aciculare CBS 342.82]